MENQNENKGQRNRTSDEVQANRKLAIEAIKHEFFSKLWAIRLQDAASEWIKRMGNDFSIPTEEFFEFSNKNKEVYDSLKTASIDEVEKLFDVVVKQMLSEKAKSDEYMSKVTAEGVK
ncbi:MAG: hypothetical protein KGI06_03780 [Candidatus Micrarchaeota archaeon]|nr:hypothetical protein [Candidatus Micrarchaeota archaeon]